MRAGPAAVPSFTEGCWVDRPGAWQNSQQPSQPASRQDHLRLPPAAGHRCVHLFTSHPATQPSSQPPTRAAGDQGAAKVHGAAPLVQHLLLARSDHHLQGSAMSGVPVSWLRGATTLPGSCLTCAWQCGPPTPTGQRTCTGSWRE